MKLTPLLALSLAGCSLYFGDTGSPTSESSLGGPLPAKCGSPEVHAISVYETRGDHSIGYHPTGEGRVEIERPGDHILVLSAYEPTDWKVSLASGARVQEVILLGYHTQTVDLPDVPVTRDTACGYSYPYNGEGCDTNDLLALVEAHTGAELTSFHGCYHASEWTLHADGSASSNCNTAAGYEVHELYGDCGGGGGSGEWQPKDFETYAPASCGGERFVRHDERYGVWVGAVLCGDAKHYKLYMSESLDEPFLEIADYAGHGQDHCELVNPAFKIPNEDDITSGGCTECSVGDLVDLIDVPVYARGVFGDPFERVTSRFWADLTTPVYACGVALP